MELIQKQFVIGLCDDDRFIHNQIEDKINGHFATISDKIKIIHYESAKQVIDRKDALDALLLDIDMPEMDGIELGYRIRQWNVEYKIIMLTGRIDRFKDAFKIGAFRFVSKPIEWEDLFCAIEDVMENKRDYQQVCVHRDGLQYQLAQKDIMYVQANGSSTLIFTENSEYRSERTLSEWAELLNQHLFIQCHKSFVVNMGMIEDIQKNIIHMHNGDKVALSRRLRSAFMNAYMTYDTRWR